jgi:hypothetical protein
MSVIAMPSAYRWTMLDGVRVDLAAHAAWVVEQRELVTADVCLLCREAVRCGLLDAGPHRKAAA